MYHLGITEFTSLIKGGIIFHETILFGFYAAAQRRSAVCGQSLNISVQYPGPRIGLLYQSLPTNRIGSIKLGQGDLTGKSTVNFFHSMPE